MRTRRLGVAAVGGLHKMAVAIAAAGALAACGGAKEDAGTKDDPVASKAAFAAMGEVLTHPRCLNCHPSGDSPTQGDAMTAHEPPVVRGEDGHGAVGMECETCHGPANVRLFEGAGTVPGMKEWHLAPRSMAWQGVSLAAICEQLKDEGRNGGKSLEEIYEHMAKDPLVGWGWAPGEGRTAAPGTQAEFAAHVRTWIDGGAHCPSGG